MLPASSALARAAKPPGSALSALSLLSRPAPAPALLLSRHCTATAQLTSHPPAPHHLFFPLNAFSFPREHVPREPHPSPVASHAVEAALAMREGRLVSDDVVLSLTLDRLSQPECTADGWVLDGLPRTAAQAAALVSREETLPDAVIRMVVPPEDIRARLVHRRRDPLTGKIYNLKTAPPTDPAVFDRLEARPDDAHDVIENRLRVYERAMPAVWKVFEAAHVPVLTVEVREGAGVDEVHDLVMEKLGDRKRVVIAGAPGCGKGTQGVRMAVKMGGVHVSTGDLLREVGRKVAKDMQVAREESEAVGVLAGVAVETGFKRVVQSVAVAA